MYNVESERIEDESFGEVGERDATTESDAGFKEPQDDEKKRRKSAQSTQSNARLGKTLVVCQRNRGRQPWTRLPGPARSSHPPCMLLEARLSGILIHASPWREGRSVERYGEA